LPGRNRVARSVNLGERGIRDEGKLGRVTNHLKVSTLLLGSHGKLVPDVHPVTVLAINALATNLNLNLSDKLLSGEVKPTSVNTASQVASSHGVAHELVDLGQSNLQVSAVAEITVSANSAGNTTTKISLAVESLLNRFN
jgi:hypothetical protein